MQYLENLSQLQHILTKFPVIQPIHFCTLLVCTTDLINSIPNDCTTINTQRITSSAPTPDDIYSEGYDEGYEQGRRDGANGHSHGYGYDDSSSYYDIL